jgi:polysaccharide export outer membrane protein
MKSKTVFFLCIVIAAALAGCAKYPELPAGTVKEIRSAVIEQQPVTIPAPADEAATPEYRVGAGDVLAIRIPGMKERIPSAGVAAEATPGYRVYSSGKVLLPMVGGVQVAGLTVDEVQEKLQEVFRPYIKEPVITVEILEYKSRALYLLGKFNSPGVQYLDRPVSLIQGIALGGGLDESANLRGARLVRQNRIVPVDIYELIYHDDLRQNVALHSGDTVYIPGNDQQNVFVLGAVKEEGIVPMINGRLSLLQALSEAGLGLGSSYDHKHVRIIRSHSPLRGELLVVDLGVVMNGDALPLPLQDGDVIYIPRSGVANWNQALADMLPSLQAIGAVIQPFVQIKFLTDSD